MFRDIQEALVVVMRHPAWLALTIVFGFVSATSNGISAALAVPVLIGWVRPDFYANVPIPMLDHALKALGVDSSVNRLPILTAAVVGALVIKNVSGFGSAVAMAALTRAVVSDVRQQVMRVVLQVDLAFHYRLKAGDLLERLGHEVNRVGRACVALSRFVVLSVAILVFTTLLLMISWRMTVISGLVFLAVALLNQTLVRITWRLGQKVSEKARAFSSTVAEVVSGMRLVKASRTERMEQKRLETLIHERERAELFSHITEYGVEPMTEMVTVAALAGLLVFSRGWIAGGTTISLLSFLVLLFRAAPLLSQLNKSRAELANQAAAVRGVAELMTFEGKPRMKDGTRQLTAINEGIRFDHVTFCYHGRDETVVQDVDFFIPRNSTMALVGPSGSGKSTLADLLVRFADPTSGRILIDGHDLREYTLDSLRKAIGLVSQDTFLFNESVRYNIAYTRPEASEQEVLDAARRAHALEFIDRLPQRFDTMIGNRGVLLSGGERQRLAIARALLSNPMILILDEATSSVDPESERLIQEAIQDLRQNRTTLVIGHRLSSIRTADQIAMIERGRVSEVGTPDELLAQNGQFARFHSANFEPEAEVVD